MTLTITKSDPKVIEGTIDLQVTRYFAKWKDY